MACHPSRALAPIRHKVMLGFSCIVLPALAARDPLDQDRLNVEAMPGARHAVTAAPRPNALESVHSLLVAAKGGASIKVAPNLGGITKDNSSTAQSLGAAITALAGTGISIESSEVQVQDSFVEATADVHRAVAQLLGIVDGDLCPHVAQGGQKHGCHLGCRCGMLQRCFSMPYVGLGSGITATNGSSDEAQGKVDVGICRMSDPALMAVLAAVSVTVFIGMLLLRRTKTDPVLTRQNVTRAELECRLQSTALSAEQRQAVLNEFCGDEMKSGLKHNLKEANFISVAAIPLNGFGEKEMSERKIRQHRMYGFMERTGGTGGTAGEDSSDTDSD